MKIIALVGPSGVGKTRLLVRLIRALHRRGLTTAAIKHSHHAAFDRPGSDSSLLRQAGAASVAVVGTRSQLAFFGSVPEDPRSLAKLLGPADVILCEGFKGADLPKIEVHRREVSAAFLCARDPWIVAAVSDEPPPRAVAWFSPARVGALADWLCERWGVGEARAAPVHPTARSPGKAERRRRVKAGRASRK